MKKLALILVLSIITMPLGQASYENAIHLCGDGEVLLGDDGTTPNCVELSTFADTNAGTLCDDNQYLDGDGGCYAVPTPIPDTNDYVNSVDFDTATGDLTIGFAGTNALSDIVENLDGRYLTTGDDKYVQIDADGAAGYIGDTASTGVLQTDDTLKYTDGGDFITLGLRDCTTNGHVLKWNGSSSLWECLADTDNQNLGADDYTTGAKITITGGTGVNIIEGNDISVSEVSGDIEVALAWDKDYNDLINTPTLPTDTNAGTICDDNQYLDGDGVCYAVPTPIPDTNDYVNSVDFDTATGDLTIGFAGTNALSDIVENLDGRYLTTGDDKYVQIDADGAAGYIGDTASTGVLQTDDTLKYTDGGDFITLDLMDCSISGHVLKWNGTDWACAIDEDTPADGNDHVNSVDFDTTTGNLTIGFTGTTIDDIVENLDGRYLTTGDGFEADTDRQNLSAASITGGATLEIDGDAPTTDVDFIGSGATTITQTDTGTITISSTDTDTTIRKSFLTVTTNTDLETKTATEKVNTVILCDATTGTVTVTLPSTGITTGDELILKKTDSSVNTCILEQAGSETIDGYSSKTIIGQYGATNVIYDGTNWWIQ